MILIVEGSNKVGKTTFINALIEFERNNGEKVFLYNKRYLKNTERVSGCFEVSDKDEASIRMLAEINMLTALNQQFPEMLIILDRFHLSELVYGKFYRGYVNASMFVIDDILSKQDASLLLLQSHEYEHADRLNISDSDIKKYKEIQDEMKLVFCTLKMKKCTFVAKNEKELKNLATKFKLYKSR